MNNRFISTSGGKILSRLYEGLLEAIRLIISFDPDLLTIVLLSLRVSITAIIISTIIGVPLGALLGLKSEKKTRFFNKLIFTFMGMPPVVAGLIIFLILSRQGPFGVLSLLYTPTAMVIAQVFLSSPIVGGGISPLPGSRACPYRMDGNQGITLCHLRRNYQRFQQGRG